MSRYIFLLIILLGSSCKAQKTITINNDMKTTPFEADMNTTATYSETIDFYSSLSSSPLVRVIEVGKTDSGKPLHEVVITNDGIFEPSRITENGKVTLLINNGIHPGEPCGIDAAMLLVKDLLTINSSLLDYATVVIIPIYNIGGSLNRGSYSRANQVGPEAYGFRGNAKNYDLNRDFIKSDSKNAIAFATIFNNWKPQIFIDNHTSNGADYQYVMTLIATQKDKLHPLLSEHMENHLLPELYASMKNSNYEMIPYVYCIDETPDNGIMGFLDLGRYSSGYAAMHHAISFMPETHMLKDYKQRVYSTKTFMESMLHHIRKHHKTILSNFARAKAQSKIQYVWTLQYELDQKTKEMIPFKGYESLYKPSIITGKPRLYYDQTKPYNREIPFFNSYKSAISVEKPLAYIIPKAYSGVIELLKLNNVIVHELENDELLKVDVYYIDDYSSNPRPYEGHFLHYDVKLRTENQSIQYYEGDFIIYTDQEENRFLIETLEPQAPDSYFAWNFFDGILMQKEYFSPYVWEDLAAEILQQDKRLKIEFEEKKSTDSGFAEDTRAQLDFIYRNSSYFEPTYLRYPIGRVIKK